MTTTASGTKSDKGASRRQHKSNKILWRPAAGDTIIDNSWTAGNNKEGSGQEQTTTNHCSLKADEQWPAERAAGNKKGKDDADEEDEQR
jgi:hypothetical protein